MTRILVVASSAVVRAGLESILSAQATLEVVTNDAGTSGELAAMIERAAPDVVLLDAARGAGSATPALTLLASGLTPDEPSPAVVALLEHPDATSMGEALQAGAHAVLPRSAEPAEIVAAVIAAAAGLIAFPAERATSLLPVLTRGSRPAGGEVETLTPREVDVLRLMAEGAGNKQIARHLGISEHTVKFHVGSILAKLGASSRTEAVTIGVRQALIMV